MELFLLYAWLSINTLLGIIGTLGVLFLAGFVLLTRWFYDAQKDLLRLNDDYRWKEKIYERRSIRLQMKGKRVR